MSKLYEVEITHKGYVVIDNDDEIIDGSQTFRRWILDITGDDCNPDYSWHEIKSVPVGEDPRICAYRKGKGYITLADFFKAKEGS